MTVVHLLPPAHEQPPPRVPPCGLLAVRARQVGLWELVAISRQHSTSEDDPIATHHVTAYSTCAQTPKTTRAAVR